MALILRPGVCWLFLWLCTLWGASSLRAQDVQMVPDQQDREAIGPQLSDEFEQLLDQ